METKDDLHRIRTSPSQRSETADLGPACWFIVSRRALAPVAACGEATKPGLAPNGSLNQQSPFGRPSRNEGILDFRTSSYPYLLHKELCLTSYWPLT